MIQAEDLMQKIMVEKHIFEAKQTKKIDLIGCVISSSNINVLVDDFFKKTNQNRPEFVSSIVVCGMEVFPSDFINDSQIGIFEVKQF